MNSKILLRSGKSPFDRVRAETVLAQDVFNNNTGNLLFQYSTWRSLSVPGASITSNGTLTERPGAVITDELVERVNSEFDVFVVPMANAFRPDFEQNLIRLTNFIKRLDINVVVTGIGAQASTSYEAEHLTPIANSVRDFTAAVLERSQSIGVRGEFTADYLTNLGFDSDKIDIIGCPSLFLFGPDHRVTKPVPAISPGTLISGNYSPLTVRTGEGELLTRAGKEFSNLEVILQDHNDLQLLLWGSSPIVEDFDPMSPDHFDHDLYQTGKLKMFVDVWPWIDYMKTREFIFGSRFHGNIAAILAGTPAFILAHDSRTLELAKLHHIPHRVASKIDPQWTIQGMADETDYSEFNAAMPALFDNYASFLKRNGLNHIWESGDDAGFLSKMESSVFEPAVTGVISTREIVQRLSWANRNQNYDGNSHRDRYPYEFDLPQRDYPMNHEFSKLRNRIREQEAESRALGKRIYELETQGWRGFIRRLRRRFTS